MTPRRRAAAMLGASAICTGLAVSAVDRYAGDIEWVPASTGLADRYAGEFERMTASNGLADRYAGEFERMARAGERRPKMCLDATRAGCEGRPSFA